MINTDLSVTPFKCTCGFQLGVYVENPSATNPRYRLAVQMWGGRWQLINNCPKCKRSPGEHWLGLVAHQRIAGANELPF